MKTRIVQLILSTALLLTSAVAFSQEENGTVATPGQPSAIVTGAEAENKKAESETNSLAKMPQSKQKLSTGSKECQAAVEAAKNACVESLSPFLKAAMTGLTAAIAAQQGAGGTQGQCQQSQAAQQPAQQNMQKFNADCSAKKKTCEIKCGEAAKGADTVNTATCQADLAKELNPATKKAELAKCQKVATENKAANEKGKTACESLGQNQAAGLEGVAQLLAGLMKSGSCQEEVGTDCSKDPTGKGCPQALDCNKEESASNPQCICQKNPRAPGCGGSTSTASGGSDQIRDFDKGSGEASPVGTGTDSSNSPNFASDSPSGGGAGMGGGGGGGGGSIGKGGGAPEKGEAAKGFDTNVLGGEGGGGGGSATSSGSVGSDDPMGKYSEYLPEEKRNPAAALSNQVSSPTGLSNWEKIRKRYSESRSSLLRPN